MNMAFVSAVNLFFISLLTLLGPCDEYLPSYSEPTDLLEGKVTGEYVLSPSANHLSLRFVITNTYDETLDGEVDIRGAVEIQSLRNPQVRKTIILTPSMVSYARQYDSIARELTLDAGDSLVFSATWDFSSDNRGVDPRQSFFVFYKDPVCSLRCLARQEEFVLRGDVLLFNRVARIETSTFFPVCYVSRYVEPRVCLSVTTNPPCLEPPSASAGSCIPSSQGTQ